MRRVAFYTLGCKVNQSESFSLMAAFMAEGFEVIPHSGTQTADVYIINSCAVTAAGDKKSLQALRRFRKSAPGALIVLCGCYPQAMPEEAEKLKEADIIIGSRGKSEIVDLVKNSLENKLENKITRQTIGIKRHDELEAFELLPSPLFAGKTRASLKIQDGCERRCSYCIIPDARGNFRSMPPDILASELNKTAEAKYKEVVLAGINLSCYGIDLGLHLTDAIAVAEKTEGIERIRLGSLEPELLDKTVIEKLKSFKKLCPHFHLSLQSGCDRTLKAMGRHYNCDEYRQIAANLREAFPDCAITTDIMTAFPGESEQDYRTSETFVREIGFSKCHIFIYSPRPGTPAEKLPGRIPPGEAKRRAANMAKAAKESERKFLESLINKKELVLFEQNRNGFWQGHTGSYILVKAKSSENIRGKILPVFIKSVGDDCCYCEIV